MAGGPVGAGLSVPFGVRALNPLMAKMPLKVPGYFFMLAVIVAVADCPHALKVDPGPDDVAVLAPLFLVQHDDASLTRQAEFLLQTIDRIGPLLVGQLLIGAGIDRGVIKRLGASGPQRPRPPSQEGHPANRRRQPPDSSRTSARSLVSVRVR